MTQPSEDHDDVAMLLPWYAAGALDAADKARVERALGADAGLRAELDLVREDRESARALAEEDSVPASMPLRFDAALEQRIAEINRATRRSETPNAGRAGWFGRFLGGFARRDRLAYAAVTAVLVVTLQAGAILALLGERGGVSSGFETASGPSVGDGIFVLVRFAADRSAEDIAAWLATNGGRIVDGPLPGGMFRLRFDVAAGAGSADLAGRLGAERDMIALVLPAQ